jgi:hypothetical protein
MTAKILRERTDATTLVAGGVITLAELHEFVERMRQIYRDSDPVSIQADRIRVQARERIVPVDEPPAARAAS